MDPGAYKELKPYLVTNTVILTDNSEELLTDETLTYQAVTKEYPMGLNISQKGLFKQEGFKNDLYLGVIRNAPHADIAVKYINYLYSD